MKCPYCSKEIEFPNYKKLEITLKGMDDLLETLKQIQARERIITNKYIEAVALLSSLAPTVLIDAEDPVKMAKEIILLIEKERISSQSTL